jgi:phenylalanyl-tRNA synthetase beta subunit
VWEKLQLSAMYYQKINNSWVSDFLLIAKGELEDMLLKLWLKWSVDYIKTDKKAYHPKKQWNIAYSDGDLNCVIWFIWTIHPLVLKENKISENSDLVYLSLDLEKIDNFIQKIKFKSEWYETLQDQIVWRDLCFVLNSSEDYSKILDVVKKVDWVVDLDVFDLYKWDNIEEWKKSIAFKIKIKWENMQTEQINFVMQKVIDQVEWVWAKLRD